MPKLALLPSLLLARDVAMRLTRMCEDENYANELLSGRMPVLFRLLIEHSVETFAAAVAVCMRSSCATFLPASLHMHPLHARHPAPARSRPLPAGSLKSWHTGRASYSGGETYTHVLP